MSPSSAPRDPPDAPAPGARATSRRVRVADAVAGVVVRAGGMLVVLAVVGILAFLVGTVLPLFRSAEVHETPVAGRVPVDGTPRVLALDEYRLLAAAVGDAPEVVVFRPATSEVVERVVVPGLEGARVTCARLSVRSHDLVLGTDDGRVAVLGLSFGSEYVVGKDADALRPRVPAGQTVVDGTTLVERRPGGTLQRIRCVVEPRGVTRLPAAAAPVVAAGYASRDGAGFVAVVGADRAPRLLGVEPEGEGGAVRLTERPLVARAEKKPVPFGVARPVAAFVDEELRTAWFVGDDGALARVDVTTSPAERRELRLTSRGDGARVTAAELVVGDRSLVIADDRGRVSVWSAVPKELAPGQELAPGDDGRTVERLHELGPFPSPVVVARACATRRTLYLGHADGTVTAVYTVNERVLARTTALATPVAAIAVGSRDDGILVAGPQGAVRGFDVHAPHPEVSVASLFRPVHYEGYGKPAWVYQSSASSDEAEPKLSLWPLVFGTIKATFYAMLFALPLALLGALYTSQFMHPRVRAVVKPTVEVMASLPSVVLGFLAALLVAPAIEDVVPGVFAFVLSLFLVGFGAGCVWNLVPSHVKNGLGSAARLLLAAGLVATTGVLCVLATPWIESSLFEVVLRDGRVVADFRRWMAVARDAAHGDGATASGLPLLRVGLFVLGSAVGTFVLPRWLRFEVPGGRAAAIGVRTLLAAVVPGLLLAFTAPLVEHVVFGGDFRWFLVSTDDPRRGIVYDMRNSLVVGVAMGFAVIPIIYTIAEDAISAIPESLRSAALGCGASPWQAATRVILPAAVPGIFSATMIGIGRAIGETMIVLMAAGGTPITDWTLFNGFRTLSVNIATEMPEAAAEGTLYRVLFLSGLLLFALTFVLNTVAEAVRLRFRRKFRGL